MIRVLYARDSESDSPEVWLDGSVLAVAAEPYVDLDEGQGGVTRGDVNEEDIKTLDHFASGDEVFVESHDPEDVLDDETEELERNTRIWWRAFVGEVEP